MLLQVGRKAVFLRIVHFIHFVAIFCAISFSTHSMRDHQHNSINQFIHWLLQKQVLVTLVMCTTGKHASPSRVPST